MRDELAPATTARLTARRALALAILASIAVACARKPGPKKPDEIVFWVTSPIAAIQPLVSRFEAANPNLHVELAQLPDSEFRSRLDSTVFHQGPPPDLCELPSGYVSHFMVPGALSDWSAGVADLRGTFRGWPMCMVGDAIYGLPWRIDTRALFYNKALFARAHLDSTRAPGTWAELRAAAARIQQLGGGVHGYGLGWDSKSSPLEQFLPFAWGNGGEILSVGLDSSRFDSPENRQTLEFLNGLRRVGMFARGDSVDSEFVAGRLGLRLAGTGLLARLEQAGPAMRCGVGLVPRADGDSGFHASLVVGCVLVSFTSSRRKEDALKLARFLGEPEQQAALARALPDMLPANAVADSVAGYRNRPELQLLLRQFETARYTPAHRDWWSLQACIEGEVGRALSGISTPAQSMANAESCLVTSLTPGAR